MLRYIGPFLRMNKLSIDQIQSQLFHLSKESIKNLVLSSKCGIVIDHRNLNFKNLPSTDINTLKSISPLLCVYKKSSAKLKNKNNKLCWDDSKQKKEIPISSNGYMTLSLLELVDYYKNFKDIDSKKYNLSTLYTEIARNQLEFFVSHMRDESGLFIDKKDCTDPLTGRIQLKPKNKSFKFSEQALFMNAFYKCSDYLDGDIKTAFKTFSLDILKMFLDFKDEIYNISFNEKCNLCFNLNVFYTYSNMEEVQPLLLDIFDLVYEEYKTLSQNNIYDTCIMYLNSAMLFKHTNMFRFKKISDNLMESLMDYYNEDLGIFVKESDDKDIKFSSDEIVLYLISMLYNSTLDDIDEKLVTNIFKYQFVDSGILLSWPDIPTLDDVEHYKNFHAKPENLLEEQYFKMTSIQSPEVTELAPIFIKNVTFNRSNNSFKGSKSTFDSRKNFNLFFLMLHLLNKTPEN
ncbi:hypothetical protein FDC62_00380 [Clostridium botulinum]|uniref:hypothetical protein n=1 Tax=Clostridium botulinum TaxID=1491 RepID=UPI0004D555D8|nr:hypothetical protein [Clostridium botulinum]KEI05707.1 hypothetical protein Z952_04965 [Clostridium botulinum C/D str. BKT75002]KEI12268.1 hypothetical protein Z954_05960 [Clostridium botulinum C/D str. BKT2873]KGM94652.1 hypothetical protein Z956_06720 [Clostridium botulinum D str. CCUG 7971]KOC49390.1 hypothetical protein ADU88_06190 [Clostridium botulinum]MCD3351327.1 hypothetical protein [Clostridium botulinum D/C]